MKLAFGLVIGWLSASALLFAWLIFRAVIDTQQDAELFELATVQPITPDPQWVADLYAHLTAATKDTQ